MFKKYIEAAVVGVAAVTIAALSLPYIKFVPREPSSSVPEQVVSQEQAIEPSAPEKAVVVEEPSPVTDKEVPSATTKPEAVNAPAKLKTADEVAKSPNETIFTTMATQTGVTWGLDAIDGTRDGAYTYISDGAGVRIYIVDTGVDATHREFGSRVVDGFDAFGQNLDQTDCNGHGTHVAGIAAGNYYGVAKAATIVPVRVMDCDGRGNTTTLTAGIDWILAAHSGGTGIVNMSIGGNKDQEVNAAVSRLISSGLVVVAAAGNSNADACNYSPGSAQGVIAVGATDQSDLKASFSNWGSCVDVSAPGVRINSANAADDNISLRMSGTSQASPFVAGAIATYLSNKSVTSPTQVEPYLRELAVDGIARVEAEPAPLPEPTPEPIVEPEPEPVEPEPSEPPVVDEPIVPEYYVTVSRVEDGPMFGELSWSQIDDASGYRVYRTSRQRPSWQLYGNFTSNLENNMLIVTDVGSSARYRVVAVIDAKEVEIGQVRHSPTN